MDDLREANCDIDVRAARSSAKLHRIPTEEFFQACDSNPQEEVKSLLTNNIIPPLKKVLCVSFNGDPLEKCMACNTMRITSISMRVAAPGATVNCPLTKVRPITCYTTDNDSDKKEWLDNLITLLQMDKDIKLEMFLTGGDVNCHLLDILRTLTL